MSHPLRAALVTAALLLAGLFARAPGAAADPSHNIAPTPRIGGSVCDPDPHSSDCQLRLVAALDHARSALGLPHYDLPGRFRWLSQREKLLVLTNQDRRLFGLTPIRGLNAKLNGNASSAVGRRSDPAPVPTLGGAQWRTWTANWAGGLGAYENPLMAYYQWMYYDGLNLDGSSWNIACRPADRSGCWKHRRNVLLHIGGSSSQLALGIGARGDGTGGYGFTQLFEVVPASAPVDYVPSVVRMSSHSAPTGGKVITVGGFGFVHLSSVTVLGAKARVLAHTPWSLRLALPAHAVGSGYLVVHTHGGTSNRNYAAAFQYRH